MKLGMETNEASWQTGKVAARSAELRAACQERTLITAGQVLQKLKQVGYAAVKGDVGSADKVADRP